MVTGEALWLLTEQYDKGLLYAWLHIGRSFTKDALVKTCAVFHIG